MSPRRASELVKLAALTLLVPSAASQLTGVVCPKFGAKCPMERPFCNYDGFCTNNYLDGFLGRGCKPDASYNRKSCVKDPGCTSYTQTFAKTPVPSAANFRGSKSANFIDEYGTSVVKDGNLHLQMKFDAQSQSGGIARVSSVQRVHYGNYTAKLRTGLGRGLVYSWILKSSFVQDAGDEIDFEWVPGTGTNVSQTNVFVNGVIDYTKGERTSFPDGQTSDGAFHAYMIAYTPTAVSWYIDGMLARTLPNNNSQFPSSDGNLFLSVWDTCKMAPGTITWAGGPSAWCNGAGTEVEKAATYHLKVESVTVACMPGYEDKQAPATPGVYVDPNATMSSGRRNAGVLGGALALLLVLSL